MSVTAKPKARKATSKPATTTTGKTGSKKKDGKVVIVETKGSRGAVWRSGERTQFLIETVGGVNKLAKTLGVSPSQPSRWKSGTETPSPEIAAKLLDLDHVIALAMQTWHPAVVMDWMTTSNGFLEGAQPIDVLLQRGPAEVIDALKATLSGAYV
jgi:transcriptional regulator with XRE-family HTH domain